MEGHVASPCPATHLQEDGVVCVRVAPSSKAPACPAYSLPAPTAGKPMGSSETGRIGVPQGWAKVGQG